MRNSLLACLGVIAACGGAAATGYALGGSASASGKRMQASDADGWIGEYRGNMDGGPATLSISAGRGAGHYAVGMDVVQPGGCSGSVQGIGVVSGERMLFTAAVPDGGGQCRIELTRRGLRLDVVEVENCHYFHGMACGFSGAVARRGPAGTPRPVMPRRPRTRG